jgi:hypothetical protein
MKKVFLPAAFGAFSTLWIGADAPAEAQGKGKNCKSLPTAQCRVCCEKKGYHPTRDCIPYCRK